MLTRKKEQPADIGGQILRLRGEIESFIDVKANEFKQSRDGAGLPVQQIRHMLTRGENCWCRAAMHVLEQTNGS